MTKDLDHNVFIMCYSSGKKAGTNLFLLFVISSLFHTNKLFVGTPFSTNKPHNKA